MSACLNCGTDLIGKYCHACGQDASTTRYNAHYVFIHDVFNGLIDYRKGFYLTLYHLMTRPGHAVYDYLIGKRAKYMNYYVFFGLAIVIFSIVEQLTSFSYARMFTSTDSSAGSIDYLLQNNPKLFYILAIPFQSIISYLVFIRTGLNFWEHVVINTYKICIVILINTVFILGSLLVPESNIQFAGKLLNLIVTAYVFWYFIQFFKYYISNVYALVLKCILTFVLSLALITLCLSLYLDYFPKVG